MRKFYALLFFVLFGVSVGFSASPYTTTAAGGNYNNPASWVAGNMPGTTLNAGETITVVSGATLTINTNVTIKGAMINEGTISLSSRLYIRDGGTLTNRNSITGTASQLYVIGTGNYVHDRNGGEIQLDFKFYTDSHLTIQGVTNSTPTFHEGDDFGYLIINCPSLTTSIDILHGTDVNNDLTISNTHTGSVTFKGGANLFNVKGNLTIAAGGKLVLEAQTFTTVAGTLTNSATSDDLYLNSDNTYTASLIANDNVLGTVERYIPANDWHLVGPATTGSTSNVFNGAYMQYYTEGAAGGSWEYITSTNYAMEKGKGYSYYKTSEATPAFVGTLYNTDVTFTNMSLTGAASAVTGWHVLSNPFSCALAGYGGGSGSWNLSNMDATGKLYNGTGAGSWQDVDANRAIPANQGFCVRVTSSTNSITIPALSRAHNGQTFLKSINSDQPFISFSLNDDLEYTYDIFAVKFSEEAAFAEYDNGLDSYELFSGSGAANISAMFGGDYLSSLGIPFSNETEVFPLALLKGDAINYTLSVTEMVLLDKSEFILEDLKTGEFINIDENTIYNFSVNANDDVHRFNLHVKNATSVLEMGESLNFSVWNVKESIYIHNDNNKVYSVCIYDISGKLISEYNNISSDLKRISLDSSSGVYVVKVLSDGQVYTQKIIK